MAALSTLDLALIALYLVFAISVGAFFRRQASSSLESFFVGDRRLSWWLAGTSMVATTFAADTPLLVTGIVATDGISGNWIWWSVAIAHLTATFFFARLWRRSGVITDAEITELRYGGRPAAALRAIKAVYFGLFINCLVMAWVIVAMVKISRSFFDLQPVWVILICVSVSVLYTMLGGFRSVVVTDLVQFTLGMGGAILLAIMLVARFGGLGEVGTETSTGTGLLGALEIAVEDAGHGSLKDVVDLVPSSDHPTLQPIFFLTLLIAGWWRWAEGNGYLVQRMAACRSEEHAQGAMLWFSILQNAIRPWPWIVVGLASLILLPRLPGAPPSEIRGIPIDPSLDQSRLVMNPGAVDLGGGTSVLFGGLPDSCEAHLGQRRVRLSPQPDGGQLGQIPRLEGTGLETIEIFCGGQAGEPRLFARFENVRVELLDREMGYPLIMAQTLPSGLLGLVIASLLAAFMSTIDTHVNWGASYMVQDIYKRFLRPAATAAHYVTISRICVVLMAVIAGVAALFIQNIAAVWRFLVALGAGLGSVSAARWFWPRVTAWAELAALAVTTLTAGSLELFGTPTLFGAHNPFHILTVPAWTKIMLIAASSLLTWIPVTIWGPPNDEAALRRFASQVRPPTRAWRRYLDGPVDKMQSSIWRFAAGLVVVFGSLVGLGDLLLGRQFRGLALVVVAGLCLALILRPERVETRTSDSAGHL